MSDFLKITSQYDHVFYVEVDVTELCNQKCYYCCFTHYNKCLIDLHQLGEFLLKLYKKFNKDIIVELIGGEPTLANNTELLQFADILSDKIGSHINVMLFSNFSGSLDLYTSLQKKNWTLFLTWHSLFNDKFNQMFIDKCFQINKTCQIYVMLENRNFEISLDVYNKLKQGIHCVQLATLFHDVKTLQIIGTGKNEYYSVKQIQDYQDIKTNEDLNNRSSLKTGLVEITTKDNRILTLSADDIDRNFNRYLCGAGKNYMYIDAHGNIHPCRLYIHKIIGNIKSDLSTINFNETFCKFNTCATVSKASKRKTFHI